MQEKDITMGHQVDEGNAQYSFYRAEFYKNNSQKLFNILDAISIDDLGKKKLGNRYQFQHRLKNLDQTWSKLLHEVELLEEPSLRKTKSKAEDSFKDHI